MPTAPLKNGMAKPAISRLAISLSKAWPTFDAGGFIAGSARGLKRLELKERVAHVADHLATFLPDDYAKAVAIIVRAGKTFERGDKDDPLREDAFTRAERVHELLQTITPIEDDAVVPADSVLREFIGGSCLEY